MKKLDLTTIVGAGVMLIAILATVAGLYQLSKPSPQPKPVAAKPQPRAETKRPPSTWSVEQELRATLPGKPLEKPPADNERCIDGILFRIEGNSYANIGRC